MSAYGPAFFIKRIDEKEIEKVEQDKLLEMVREISKLLKIKDEDNRLASARFYDYNNYEPKSIGFLMFSSHIWGMMPENIQKDQSEADAKKILKIGKEIDKIIPKTYQYLCYYIET